MVSKPIPLLFHFPEDTYLRAFVYAALTAAITTGIVLEYRLINPFGTYMAENRIDAHSHITAVLQTCAVAFASTLIALVILHLLFAMGDSLLDK